MADEPNAPIGPNGHGAEPTEPTVSRILTLDSARHPMGKAGDWITRQQAADMMAKALAEEVPKIHEFYLNQLPNFVARMVQDALLHYGLIKPIEPVDIAPGGEGSEKLAGQSEGVAVAGEGTPAVGPTSVDAGGVKGPIAGDPEAALPAPSEVVPELDTRGSA